MAKGFKHGAGGTDALNFKVVGGTEQPVNPKENTVWVNTDTAISGWAFSPEEPAGPSEGLVWIGLGTASPAPFNALKKEALYCYPTACRQYAGGAWVNAEAYVYTDGAWVQFSAVKPAVFIVFDGGSEADYTGTWSGNGGSSGGVLSVTNGGYNSFVENSYLSSAELIDMSDYSTLHFIVSEYNKYGKKTFGLGTTTVIGSYDIASVSVTGKNEYTIDIQSVDSCFINLLGGGFQAGSGGYETGGYAVSKIWLE